MTSMPQQLPPRVIVGARFTVMRSCGLNPVVGKRTSWPTWTRRGPFTCSLRAAYAGTAVRPTTRVRTSAIRAMDATLWHITPRGRASRAEPALVEPVALDDLTAHRLQPAVHAAVGGEDPARLAALERRPLGEVEVLLVQQRGRAGHLVLRL